VRGSRVRVKAEPVSDIVLSLKEKKTRVRIDPTHIYVFINK